MSLFHVYTYLNKKVKIKSHKFIKIRREIWDKQSFVIIIEMAQKSPLIYRHIYIQAYIYRHTSLNWTYREWAERWMEEKGEQKEKGREGERKSEREKKAKVEKGNRAGRGKSETEGGEKGGEREN